MPSHPAVYHPPMPRASPTAAIAASIFAAACSPTPSPDHAVAPSPPPLTIASAPGAPRPPYHFSADDDAFLNDIEHGAFNYLWHASGKAGMCPDRSSKPIVSVAGVGFQLSAIPVGVERHWISREEGEQRTLLILDALAKNPDNRKAGLFYHFIDADTAGQPSGGYEHAVSTVDSALLFAGLLTASSYFGGDVQRRADALFAAADWRFFIAGDERDGGKGTPIAKSPPHDFERGFIALSWRPDSLKSPSGDGKLSPYYWLDSGDEHRLVTFLAVCAPVESRRADASLYYRLRRQVGAYTSADGQETGPFVYVPFSGALFTAFFAHCWLDYSHMGADDPASFGADHRPSVDWWENSRRTARLHQLKCAENPEHKPNLGKNAWGLSACDAASGYIVPGLYPPRLAFPGERQGFDFSDFKYHDDYDDGTLAPYAAGCSILFDRDAALAALHYDRSLDLPLWHDPASGGFGFQDSFNLPTRWFAPDCVAIDQGPLLLCLENARTGLIWRLFSAHPAVRAGLDRLRLAPTP